MRELVICFYQFKRKCGDWGEILKSKCKWKQNWPCPQFVSLHYIDRCEPLSYRIFACLQARIILHCYQLSTLYRVDNTRLAVDNPEEHALDNR